MKTVAALACALWLAGCAMPPPQADLAPLGGTSWQLVAIQSMDDAQGTLRIAEAPRFTLRLEADGRALLQLDCNRAFGAWSAQPAQAEAGSFRFTGMASTKALCAPPHLDERIARDLEHVRGFRRIDGRLYLALMADAAIYEWAPVP